MKIIGSCLLITDRKKPAKPVVNTKVSTNYSHPDITANCSHQNKDRVYHDSSNSANCHVYPAHRYSASDQAEICSDSYKEQALI